MSDWIRSLDLVTPTWITTTLTLLGVVLAVLVASIDAYMTWRSRS